MKFWVLPHKNLKDHLQFVSIASNVDMDGKILILNLIRKRNLKNRIRILQEKVLKKIVIGDIGMEEEEVVDMN